MELDNQVTVIEISADYLCLIILSDRTTMDELIEEIRSVNPIDKTQYISVKIDNPSANKSNELMRLLNESSSESDPRTKSVLIDDGVEVAQCYTYAEGYSSKTYMLMTLTENDCSYTLGYPKFDLGDEEDPETLVEDWFKKKIKKVPNGVKKNIKYITVVGTNTNILVVATKLKKKEKKD